MKEAKEELDFAREAFIKEFDRKNVYYLELRREVGGSKYTKGPNSCWGSVTCVSPREILLNRDGVKDIMIRKQGLTTMKLAAFGKLQSLVRRRNLSPWIFLRFMGIDIGILIFKILFVYINLFWRSRPASLIS